MTLSPHARRVLAAAGARLRWVMASPAARRVRLLPAFSELLADVSMLDAGAGNHVADALPHLVEAIQPRLAAALQQRFELWWR